MTCLVPFLLQGQANQSRFSFSHGGIVKGDSTKKELALVFTADEFAEGLPIILQTLKEQNIRAGFFFTGRFYRNKAFKQITQQLHAQGHYLGPHADMHLLYCDWTKRDSLLVTRDSFEKDLNRNLAAMIDAGLPVDKPHLFIPPFEWWNDSISQWSKALGLAVINFTPGIRTNTDYTWPQLPNYKSSKWIINSVKEIIATTPDRLNGSIILIHAGTDPKRKDKLYNRLKEIVTLLKKAGYQFHRIDSLLHH